MSSSDFQAVPVKDPVLCVNDSIKFGVFKSGSQVNVQQYAASSQSTNSINFSITTPSEITVIDRHIMLESTWTLQIDGTPKAGQYLLDYAGLDALNALPLQQGMSTSSVTINNATMTLNNRDVLGELLRCYGDERALSRYLSSTPIKPDVLYSSQSSVPYGDAASLLAAANNANQGINVVADNSIEPRGGVYLRDVQYLFPGPAPAAGYQSVVPYSSDAAAVIPIGTGAAQSIRLVFTSIEPLFLSPFHFSNLGPNQSGIYGITNLSFLFNLTSPNRVFRTGGDCTTRFNGTAAANYNVSLYDVANSKLWIRYITPAANQRLPTKCVNDYVNFNRFITSANGTVADNLTASVASANLQLSVIPDMLIMGVRKKITSQNTFDSTSWLPVEQVSIQWDNSSGLLSSLDARSLWQYSSETTNQTWNEFRGYAAARSDKSGATASALKRVNMSGGLLSLKFGSHIQLPNIWSSAGALGTYQLQVNITVKNNTGASLDLSTYELVIITMQSGLVVSSMGVSASYVGLLDKESVMSVSDESTHKPICSSDLRLVGGVESSVINSVANVAPKTQEAIMDAVKAAKDAVGSAAIMGGRMAARVR